MSWALAFVIVGSLLVVCLFALFMIVYLKELAREEKIIASYGDSLKTMPIMYVDQFAAPKQPLNPAIPKDKKIIN